MSWSEKEIKRRLSIHFGHLHRFGSPVVGIVQDDADGIDPYVFDAQPGRNDASILKQSEQPVE